MQPDRQADTDTFRDKARDQRAAGSLHGTDFTPESDNFRREALRKQLGQVRNTVVGLVDAAEYEQAVTIASYSVGHFEEYPDLYLRSLLLNVELHIQLVDGMQKVEELFVAGLDRIQAENISTQPHAIQFAVQAGSILSGAFLFERAELFEAVLAQGGRVESELRGAIRKIAIKLGAEYLNNGQLERAESLLLRSITADSADAWNHLARLRLGETYQRCNKFHLALPLFRAAEQYFLFDSEDAVEPEVAFRLGFRAATRAIAMQREALPRHELAALVERIDTLAGVVSERVPEAAEELSILAVQRFDVLRFTGQRDSVLRGLQAILATEEQYGRSSNEAARAGRLVESLVRRGIARVVHSALYDLAEQADIDPALIQLHLDVIQEARHIDMHCLRDLLTDLDLLDSFAEILPLESQEKTVPLGTVLRSFLLVRESAAKAVDVYFRMEAEQAQSPADAARSLVTLQQMYELIDEPARASDVQVEIEHLSRSAAPQDTSR